MSKVIVLLSPSSAGKDTILKKLINNYNYFNFTNLVSHTTRPKRDYECNGKDYYFTNKDNFNKIKMIEKREYNTLYNGKSDVWYYGLSEMELHDKLDSGNIPIVILDYHGLHEFKEYCSKNDIEVIPFYIQVNPIVRFYRCIKRGNFSLIEYTRRFIDDVKAFNGAKNECIVIQNKDVDFACVRILEYIRKLEGKTNDR